MNLVSIFPDVSAEKWGEVFGLNYVEELAACVVDWKTLYSAMEETFDVEDIKIFEDKPIRQW